MAQRKRAVALGGLTAAAAVLPLLVGALLFTGFRWLDSRMEITKLREQVASLKRQLARRDR